MTKGGSHFAFPAAELASDGAALVAASPLVGASCLLGPRVMEPPAAAAAGADLGRSVTAMDGAGSPTASAEGLDRRETAGADTDGGG
jgi:hypothetical protein